MGMDYPDGISVLRVSIYYFSYTPYSSCSKGIEWVGMDVLFSIEHSATF